MPVPTRNFYNIRRLNRIFALSAVGMLACFLWAIWHDYDRPWRAIQRENRTWSVALIDQRISRLDTQSRREAIEKLDARIAGLQALYGRPASAGQPAIPPGDADHARDLAEMKNLARRSDSLSMRLANLKSQIAVREARLQDAHVAGNQNEARKLEDELAAPRRRAAEWTEQIAAWNRRADELRASVDRRTVELDDLLRQRSRLESDIAALQQQRRDLAPQGFWAKTADKIRALPLLQFINPRERIRQVVLPDIQTDLSFTRVQTTDRCITCHTNIDRPEFSRAGVTEYLEAELAQARAVALPATPSARPDEPPLTLAKPGPAAMPEFWIAWGRQLKPPAATRSSAARAKTLASTVGDGPPDRPVRITEQGSALAAFTFDPADPDPARQARQQSILIAITKAWLAVDSHAASTDGAPITAKAHAASPDGRVVAAIDGAIAPATFNKARLAALKLADAFRTGLATELDPSTARVMDEKYRLALVAQVNAVRQSRGEKLLDPSPVFLAHSHLELYSAPDSPHPLDKVGCTSCHDGSGNETDFVLAAHRPRPILVDAHTGEPILPSQLTGAGAYFDPVTGRAGRAISQSARWKDRFESASGSSFEEVGRNWDLPMRPAAYLQASCARCHNHIGDIAPKAPELNEGRMLFARLGCSNCHQLDTIPAGSGDKARVGPDLRLLPAKLSNAIVNTWIWAPRQFRPSTLMPHAFLLENNSSPEEIRRTRLETRAMTEYLAASATPGFAPAAIDPAVRGDPIRGQELFEKLGCSACHTNLADPVEWDDPDTKKEPTVRRAQQWIVTDLVQRAGMSEEQALAAYGRMNYNQKQEYCLEQFGQLTSSGRERAYPDGTPRPRFITFGPELSGIGQKLTTGRSRQQASAWLADWLKNPSHYSGTSSMPSLRLSDLETAHLVEYLLAQMRRNLDPADAWQPQTFDIDPPKLDELVAWFLRTQYSPEQADAFATQERLPDGRPGEMTLRAAEALTAPSILSAERAQQAATSMSLQQKQLVFLGKRLIAYYGCQNCHAINGMESAVSPCPNLTDWGQKQISKLDFGYVGASGPEEQAPQPLGDAPPEKRGPPIATPVPLTREGFLEAKLGNPRIYDRGRTLLDPRPGDRGRPYDKLRMPRFNLSAGQIHALVAFVTSNRARLISDRMRAWVNDTQHTRLALGRQAAERFNCTSCHAIQDNDPAIAQYFAAEREDMSRYWLVAPPSLAGEGARVQPAWLYGFLKNVEPIRPQMVARMPTFPLSDGEAETLTAYFAAVAREQSRWLVQRLRPIEQYIASVQNATTRPGVPSPATRTAEPAPGDDWYTQESLAGPARELEAWALAARLPQMTAASLDPRRTTGVEADRVHRTLLFEARFLARLDDAPYPLVESPRPQVPPEQFNKGEAFFKDLACLQCHTLGEAATVRAGAGPLGEARTEPAALGRIDPAAPKGPDLANIHRRIQRRWALHWVQQTNLILPVGSPMPPFFDGLPAWRQEGLPAGQDAPTLADMPESKRKKAEALIHAYGATAPEQKDLLLNFIYSAGVRNYAVPRPTTRPAAER